jgi:hypothetical protein
MFIPVSHAHCGKSPIPPRQRPAAVTVEFAIIGSLLVFLILGAVEVSRGFMVKEALSNAVRSGGRVAAQAAGTNAAVTQEVKDILSENRLDPKDAAISILVNDKSADVSSAVRYDKVTIRVEIPASKVYYVTALFFSENEKVVETIVMMRQQ